MSDPIDTAELRRLLEKATPGPWEVFDDAHYTSIVADLKRNPTPDCRVRADWIAECDPDNLDGGKDRADANVALIVALRNAAGPLLDALDSTRKALAESEAAGAVLTKAAGERIDHDDDCRYVTTEDGYATRRPCSCGSIELQNALANLPASVRRHVAVDAALEEVARLTSKGLCCEGDRPFHTPEIKAALAKLDAARRGEP